MFITLITTTRDRPDLFIDCILSVAKQTYKNFEWLIYIDDDIAKYDRCLWLIQKLIPQAQVFGGVKIGRAKALHVSHLRANGDYIGWLDDDDWLHPDCLQYCSGGKSEIIYTDFFTVKNGIANISGLNKIPFNKSNFLKNNCLFHFLIFSKQIYLDSGNYINCNFDTTMDVELRYRMLSIRPISPEKIDKSLYFYRLHKNRISINLNRLQRANFIKIKKLYEHQLKIA